MDFNTWYNTALKEYRELTNNPAQPLDIEAAREDYETREDLAEDPKKYAQEVYNELYTD